MKLWRKFVALFRKEKLDADMAEEFRLHLEQRTREHLAAGMPPDEARYAARRKFGGVEQVKEIARDQRGWGWLDPLAQDVRYGARTLRKNPGFTTVAVATLALGIGANTAIFTLTNALMLRPLPVPEPGQLVLARKSPGDASFSYLDYERFRAQVRSFSGLVAVQNFATRRWLIATGFGGSDPEPVQAQTVSGNFFTVLGAAAALGRTFAGEDDRANREGEVVLSHAFWQRRFGGDPTVLGKTVQLGQAPVTIVGVMPERFSGFYVGVQPDLWWPVQLFSQVEPGQDGAASALKTEGWEWLLMVGRLRPDVTLEMARAELRTIFRQQVVDFAESRAARWTEAQRREHFGRTLELDRAATGFTNLRQRFSQPLTVLMVIVGVVLLIACANLAGLLLARGVARQREFAVRTALGAGRGRLIRQMVTESLLLALAGGALGLLFAHWGTAFLATYLPAHGSALDLAPDRRVLLFAIGASVLTGILFGLVPAFRASRVDLAMAMKLQSAQAAGGARSRLNAALVVAQIAMSGALLAGAGLFVRSLRNLKAVDLGFRRENIVMFSLESARSYDANQRADVNRRLLQAIESAPGVRSATLANGGVMSGESLGTRFTIDGFTAAPDEEMRVQFVIIGPRFFETLSIPLLRGRELNAVEAAAGPTDGVARKAVISEAMARRFFGDTDPLGRMLRHNLRNSLPLEIIGVAKDTKYRNVRETTPLEYYVPYFGGVMSSPMSFYVRTTHEPAALAANVRAIVRQLDPNLLVAGLRTLDDVVDNTLVQERVVAQLGGFFGGFALILASLGLYGILSYAVVQRTREIGVRMALGARTADVIRLVVGQGMQLAAFGAIGGVVLAFGLTRLVAKLLYGVTPDDPTTFAGVALLLLVVATFAAWLPARRAAKVDPMVALRAE